MWLKHRICGLRSWADRTAITEGLMNKLAKIDPIEETADVLATIGRNIRRLRNERGLTLQALADQTQLSASMLSLLERGKTGPSIGTLVVIASALGAQMSDLIDGER